MPETQFMQWPFEDQLQTCLAQVAIPSEYQLTQLARGDVDAVIALLGSWYPDIAVGGESRHLRREFFTNETFLRNGDANRDRLPLIARRGPEVVGFITFERNIGARTLSSPLAVIAPKERGSGLSIAGWGVIEALGTWMGAELLYSYVTLKTVHQQRLAEKYGFKLVGIVPGNDRDLVAPGQIRRVYEALYVKCLEGTDPVLMPDMAALTDNTKQLWKVLFGSDSERWRHCS